MFPPQPNDPHRLVIKPVSLQCHPRYSRSNDISLVYSSSLAKAANHLTKWFTLYHFRGLFYGLQTAQYLYQLHSSCGLSAIYSVDNITDTFVFPERIISLIQRTFSLNWSTKLRHLFQFVKYFRKLFFQLRGKDSNLRPQGYEPCELPLLLPHDILF